MVGATSHCIQGMTGGLATLSGVFCGFLKSIPWKRHDITLQQALVSSTPKQVAQMVTLLTCIQ
jgi:hypothetical protein